MSVVGDLLVLLITAYASYKVVDIIRPKPVTTDKIPFTQPSTQTSTAKTIIDTYTQKSTTIIAPTSTLKNVSITIINNTNENLSEIVVLFPGEPSYFFPLNANSSKTINVQTYVDWIEAWITTNLPIPDKGLVFKEYNMNDVKIPLTSSNVNITLTIVRVAPSPSSIINDLKTYLQQKINELNALYQVNYPLQISYSFNELLDSYDKNLNVIVGAMSGWVLMGATSLNLTYSWADFIGLEYVYAPLDKLTYDYMRSRTVDVIIDNLKTNINLQLSKHEWSFYNPTTGQIVKT